MIDSSFTILCFNARSLLPKLDNLRAECAFHNPLAVCITESWLDEEISDNELSINDYCLLRLDRSRHGGGVALYVRDTFLVKTIFVGNHSFECIVVSIFIGSCTYCLCLLYRPPGSGVDILDQLHSMLGNLNISLFSHFLLIGDFNVNYFAQFRSPLFSKLVTVTSSFSLSQIVTEPTHFSHSGVPSTIDLAFVSRPDYVSTCYTVPPLSNSDHRGIFISYRIPRSEKRPRSTQRTIWCYSLGDFDRACELLDETDWDRITSVGDIDQSWSNWQSVFLNVISTCVPRKTLPCRKHLPWISPAILKAIKRRNVLLKAFKRSGNPQKYLEYKQVRNRIVSTLRSKKQLFFEKMQAADHKTFWKLFKVLTKKKSSIPVLRSQARLIYDDAEKANVLNRHFFENFNHQLRTCSTCPTPACAMTDSSFPEEYLCNESQVLSLISSLDIKKATGSDGISARMLRETAHSIAGSLTTLFNLSLKTGCFPTDWKFARVVPIPKSGDPQSPANYRPISILSILSKLLERHVHRVLSHHLSINCPLSHSQWGFTKGKSTTTALLSYTHECQQALDSSVELCSVFFDLSKAFDTVPHQPLLYKLSALQVNPFILRWISSYLTGRSQSVVLGGTHSSTLPVVSGVPQGSVLGPLLFLVYIDGVTSSTQHSKTIMYADDIAINKIIRNPMDYTYLQDDIDSICSWITTNYLSLNISKCCYMVFSRKRQPTLPTSELSVGDGNVLSRVGHFKYLGLNLSSDLSWSHHVNIITKKARKIVGLLYRTFYTLSTPPVLLQLYKSLVRPHVEYACTIWDPHLNSDIQSLEGVQKFALRVCSKSWTSDYASLLDAFDLPSLSVRRSRLRLCLLFGILTGQVVYPAWPFTHRVIPYPSRLANSLQLTVPRYHTTQFQHSFFPCTIEIWNSLNFDANGIVTVSGFKHSLSLHNL